jgi:hypothetical protein
MCALSIPLPQLMSSLATVLSTPTSPTPPHVRKLCSSLLTQHLLRPGGVGALCAAVFGDLDSEDEPELDKLEHVARVLGTVPRGMQPKVWWLGQIDFNVFLIQYCFSITFKQ